MNPYTRDTFSWFAFNQGYRNALVELLIERGWREDFVVAHSTEDLIKLEKTEAVC